METDLSRSLRLLEDAVSHQGKGLFKTPKPKSTKPRNLDLSLTMTPEEIERLLSDTTMQNSTVNYNHLSNILVNDKTLTGSVIHSEEPWKGAGENLYLEFLEVLQSNSDNNDVLQVVSDLTTCCSDTLNVMNGLKAKVAVTSGKNEETWLENERNIWRLLYILYSNRLEVKQSQDDFEGVSYTGRSEKLCMQLLFKQNNLIRETQLVIDWLECNARERDDDILHFSDHTSGWENTYHQLMSGSTIVFKSSREIVTSLDPDAPEYQQRALHDLDAQDEKRLCNRVFTEIRCGKLDEAQKLCMHCGHAWRAAMLEGWKLYHNPNYTEQDGEPKMDQLMDEVVDFIEDIKEDEGKMEIEGNENRDIWKLMAWKFCENNNLDIFDRAAIAAYCGNLRSLISVSSTWEDHLWSYLKVIVDIKVESEIRDSVNKTYRAMPEEYWAQRMSMGDIFVKLEKTIADMRIKGESAMSDYLIEKHIILDQIPELFVLIDNLVEDAELSTQYLRFLSHLTMFFEQIGKYTKREVVEKVLQEYIRRLIDRKETQLVSFYVSKLMPSLQVYIYAGYLEKIIINSERISALEYGKECGLDVFAITKKIVENIRAIPPNIAVSDGLFQKMNSVDEFKVSCIDWLLFYEAQRADALIQTNALIFTFITLKKMDAAQAIFNKLPSDIIDNIMAMGSTSENVQQGIREHLSYKAYLEAQEAFSAWFHSFKAAPNPPPPLPAHAQFTECVAHEHRISQHRAEAGRWRIASAQLGRTARTRLYDVLLFPDGGWLDAHGRLRALCLPEVALLLLEVLQCEQRHADALQLADVLASEKYGLYKVFSKEKRREIFTKIAESSFAFLKEKKDPWGEEPTI